MAGNNSGLLPARNEERIRTLEREMGQMRETTEGLDQRLDDVEQREAERKGQITAYAAIGAIIGTAVVQLAVRMIFGT